MKNATFFTVCRDLVRKGDQFLARHPSKFHKEASELLATANLHDHYDYSEIVEQSFHNQFKHEQNFTSSEFSDLPITIARGERCFIDVYYWRRNPTTIHNHHFTGAFQCLRGKNIDSEFRFRRKQKITPFHTIGELEEIHSREVRPGDIQPINLQDKFIHQNHHHGDLTVNLCFRTPDYPGKNLANFLYSGLKFEKDRMVLARARRLYDFALIDEISPEKLNINLSDAFNFVLNTHGSGTSHPRILAIEKFLKKKITRETGVDLSKLLRTHDQSLDKMQSMYE
jgi:hypothetical protein